MKYNFDQVSVEKPGGGYNLLTAEQFEQLPMDERIKLMVNGKLQFIRDGKVIPVKEALNSKAAA